MVVGTADKNETCLEYLKKAEGHSSHSPALKSVTFGNYAHFYKKIGKTRVALSYLQQVEELESKNGKSSSLADTHLNMCAVLSGMGKHEEAVLKCTEAIAALQDELLCWFLAQRKKEKEPSGEGPIDEETKKKQKQKQEERVAVMVIAYYNMAVEYEHLSRVNLMLYHLFGENRTQRHSQPMKKP